MQAQTLEANCRKFGIRAFYGPNDPNQGVEHVVMDEQGLVRPGMVVICGDSHTTTHGALGALGFGIGTSEIEHLLATQTLVYRMAGTMRISIAGQLPAGTEPNLSLQKALLLLHPCPQGQGNTERLGTHRRRNANTGEVSGLPFFAPGNT